MKISIIGAGNVGSLSAMRIAQAGLADVELIDVAKGLAQGKAYDLEDAQAVLKCNYNIQGSDDINKIKGSSIIVITAGLTRKPGMTREELLVRNGQIIKDVCSSIKNLASGAVVIVVTNPLDLMTYQALRVTGFNKERVFGMGVSLDASRFANIIAKDLNLAANEIEAVVIGTHGEGMLPLPRYSKVKGASLEKTINTSRIESLVKKTTGRGAEIVSCLGNGSAFFAPSAAIADLVKAVCIDEKKIIGVSAYLDGEYGIKGICLGAPCAIGKNGIDKIIELDLTEKEQKELLVSAESMRNLLNQLPPD